MKKFLALGTLLLALVVGIFSFADAASRVRGYYRSNGTYVQPYYRSSPNSSRLDNWSAKGNYNPYTGKKGYLNSYKW